MIQTDDMQWTYEVRGIPPVYRPPIGKVGVSTRMDPSLTKSLGKQTKKNYMKANMNVKTHLNRRGKGNRK